MSWGLSPMNATVPCVEVRFVEGFIRPEATVLTEGAIVPDQNYIAPPPNQFTHTLMRVQPFYFLGAQQSTKPDGEFPADERVVLLAHDGGSYCRVVNGQGLYVEVEYDSLKKLE